MLDHPGEHPPEEVLAPLSHGQIDPHRMANGINDASTRVKAPITWAPIVSPELMPIITRSTKPRSAADQVSSTPDRAMAQMMNMSSAMMKRAHTG